MKAEHVQATARHAIFDHGTIHLRSIPIHYNSIISSTDRLSSSKVVRLVRKAIDVENLSKPSIRMRRYRLHDESARNRCVEQKKEKKRKRIQVQLLQKRV